MISELPLTIIKRIKVKGKWKMKDKTNDGLWYAKFYFSDKPMKGEIEIIYK